MDRLQTMLNKIQVDTYHKNGWLFVKYSNNKLTQGWKLHVSSQLKDACNIFYIVAQELEKERCNYKVLDCLDELKKLNSPREVSPTANKFITIYPSSRKQAKRIILNLKEKLEKYKAPRILSDFQCGKYSPIHYRYGAFKAIKNYNFSENKIVYMMKNSRGELVEDLRLSYPYLPEGVKDLFTDMEKNKLFKPSPEIPENHPLNHYNIECILKKSNRGNVYRAIEKSSNQKVIIKHARPYVYSWNDGFSAIDELKSEAANLKVFQDKSYTTDLIEEFYVNEDYFVVQKFIPGYNFFDLKNIDIEKNVIINNIIDIINDIHAEGYLAVDISPTNFILDDFGRVRLIDLENFTNKNNTVRRAATKFMINTDCPSKICTIQQDYFALAMLSFAIMREHVLIFEGEDVLLNITALDKIKFCMYSEKEIGNITKSQFNWLMYLLNLSEQEKLDRFEKMKYINDFEDKNIEFHLKKVDSSFNLQIENETLINYLLSLNMNRESRILNSNEFGEFVSPISFQHGLSGYLFYLSHMRDISENGRIIEWIISEGNQNKGNVYLNGCSILFGSSGYLWVLLEFYKKITSNNPSRELIIDKIRDIYKDLISSYQKVEVFDFALGKSGILLSLMKYCINFNDVDSMEFIREKIEELYLYFVDEIRNVNSLKECNFAHGLAGIAYVILIYNSEFEFKVAYENSIKVFNNLLENLLENEYSRLNATPTNLELSWCEGTSGILLYFELLYDKRYSNIISRFQQLAFKFNLIQSSCYCHGLSSLLQTLNYQDKLNLRENVIEILLSRSKRDKNGILVFECEESSDTLFDFGIGNLGIYWSILGERFPFELKKEL